MKPEDITIDTTVGELQDAFRRGDLTIADWAAQQPRIEAARVEREAGREKAVAAVREDEARKRARTGRWSSTFIIGGDGWRGYLVKCGRASWHVSEGTFAVKRIR